MSLKSKLLSLTLGIVGLLGLCTLSLVNRLSDSTENSILKTFGSYSTSLQASIAAQFYERYGDVQAFAINPVMRSGNKSEIISYLNKYSAMYGIYDLILVVDSRGKLVAVNDRGPDGKSINVASLYGKDYSRAPWFKAALEGRFTEDKERGLVGTFVEEPEVDAYVSEAFGEMRYGNSFSAPIKGAKDEVIGVVSNRAGARWFENEFANLYGGMKKAGLANTELTLINKQGVVMVDYDPTYSGSMDIRHDYNVIGKLNLAEKGVEAAKEILAGREGQMISMHARKHISQVTGFAPIFDQKFIPSLGWGVLVRSSAAEAFASLHLIKRTFYIAFSIIVVLTGIGTTLFSTSLAKRLQMFAERLGHGANEVLNASAGIARASSDLASSVAEEAAAIQQTAASTEEVSAMAARNTENARHSKEAAASSNSVVEKGKQIVTDMIRSIEEINASNTQIMNQVESGHQEIAQIAGLITEIGSKTKVINDIVFQTKLLSFNASVEAARAGEAGKGFAVVAEEVGNLATMSGTAAKEISRMLEGSIQKVENIIQTTQSRVNEYIQQGRQKVELGAKHARKCAEVLDEIVTKTQSMSHLVGEIATASEEQTRGVREISQAMSQLDEATQKNSATSHECSEASELLKQQVLELGRVVDSLKYTVQGVAPSSAKSAFEAHESYQDGEPTHDSRVVKLSAGRPPSATVRTPQKKVKTA